MLRKTLCILFLLTACEDVTPLNDSSMCGKPCAVTEDGQILFDEDASKLTCHLGQVVCISEDELECHNYVLRSAEVCDGFDNDCNQEIDEGYLEDSPQALEECQKAPGVCAHSSAICESEWICIPPSNYGDEICDLLDNDCDGLIDNEDPSLTFVDGDLFGYDGPVETANVGECKGYVRRCGWGYEEKVGQVLPKTEICGDGLDNDCDGVVDENESDSPKNAYVLMIDVSGSMSDTQFIVSTTICNWANDPIFVDSKFAIIAVGLKQYYGDYDNSPYVKVVTDFVPPQQACHSMNQSFNGDLQSGGLEYFPEAILMTHREETALSWPEGLDKQIIVFSDEEPQSMPPSNTDWQLDMVKQDCVDNDYKLGAFTSWFHQSDWDELTTPCDGWTEVISSEATMVNDMSIRLRGEC